VLVPRVLLVPHLPTLLLDQHRGHRTPMIAALEAAAERLLAEAPEVVVALSARWDSTGPFLADASARLRTITDYAGFGVEVRYDCDGDPGLARALVVAGQKARLRVAAAIRGVDSGITVPLHFLFPQRGVRVVPLSLAPRPAPECRAWGACLRRALAARPERAVFLVGGLLSNNHHAWNLGREVPAARAFDEQAIAALTRGAWGDLTAASDAAAEAQPEAGMRHVEVLRGFLGEAAAGELRCYEPSPGVGSALIEFEVAPCVATRPSPAA
jgi:aromatic ring-opening dioxygenase catalytic subunit (LigB family)